MAAIDENKNFSIKTEKQGKAIYLDMQATTPVDPRVLDDMLPFYVSLYGNPHSRTHKYGWEALDYVEESREVRFFILISLTPPPPPQKHQRNIDQRI
jgi:selenocysteine lyase/cysteine desulfurase